MNGREGSASPFLGRWGRQGPRSGAKPSPLTGRALNTLRCFSGSGLLLASPGEVPSGERAFSLL